MVDRGSLIQRLACAEKDIIEADQNLSRQREIVAHLESRGFAAREPRRLLAFFEELRSRQLLDSKNMLAEFHRLESHEGTTAPLL